MARMPGAEWLGEHSPQTPMTRYDVVCVHTIVGYAPAHAAHFSVKADGRIQQSRDTRYRSAANLEGNHRVISIENEDHGAAFGAWSGSNVPRLTDAQVEANARILRWAHETHGIPLQLCPDSRPTSRGLGYHRQGIDGNFTDGHSGRVSGGETWTEHFGKVCPGKNRIAQIPQILDIARNGAAPEGFVMDKEARERFGAIDNRLDELDEKVDRALQFLAFSRKRELLTNKRLKSLGLTAEQIEAVVSEMGGDVSPRA